MAKTVFFYSMGQWWELGPAVPVPIASSKAVKCTLADSIGSYLQYDFAGVGPCYVSTQFYIPTATQTTWQDSGQGAVYPDSPYLINMIQTSSLPAGSAYKEYVHLDEVFGSVDNIYDVWTGLDFDYDNFPSADTVTLDTWQTIEVMRDTVNGPGPAILRVDGVLQENVTFASRSGDIDRVLNGIWVNHVAAPQAGIVWVGKIKIGSTDGGSDILDFDPSLATDLSVFTVVGTCELVDAPAPLP